METLTEKEQKNLAKNEKILSMPQWKYYTWTSFLCAGALNAPIVLLRILGIYDLQVHWSFIPFMIAAGVGCAWLLRKHTLNQHARLTEKANIATE